MPLEATTTCSTLKRKDGNTIAYHRLEARAKRAAFPGVVFMGGFRSDMTGTKAVFLETFCREKGVAFLRFDYFGHGRSSGDFEQGTIGRWKEDALAALDALTEGPQVIVGSSMGGWLMLLSALARPERVHALVGIATAPDFTEELLWDAFTPAQKEALLRDGKVRLPSEYCEGEYVITRALIEEGRDHLLLRGSIPIARPVRLLHGARDRDVPYTVAERLLDRLESEDASLRLIHDGDHRLSTPTDLATLGATLEELLGR